MKTLFIPAKVNSELNEKRIDSLIIPEKSIAIAYSIQYKDIAERVQKILSKRHKITGIVQVLGCSKPKFSKETKAVLLITSGQFHGVSLAFESKLPIYILESSKLRKISEEEIYSFEKKKHVSHMKFLNSEKVGVLVSTKPGQERLKRALELQKELKNKKTYLFISNELDTRQFENFKMDAWINTGCPRLDFEGYVFNSGDLETK